MGADSQRRAKVSITAGAESDLAEIYRRRLSQRGADGADGANALLEKLVAALESLEAFWLRGSAPPELQALGINDYRQLLHPPYRIIYLPAEQGGQVLVNIMIIADGRRDFRMLLQERLLRENRG